MFLEFDFPGFVSRQVWQLTAVLVGVGVLVWLGGRRRPHLAYALWLVVLVKAITPPLWVSNLSLFSVPEASEMGWAVVVPQEEPPRNASDETSVLENSQIAFSLAAKKQKLVLPQKTNWLLAATTVWLIGAASLASVSAMLVFLRWRRMRNTEVSAEPELLEAVSRISKQLGLRRAVRLLVTNEGYGPALFGVWRPTIVLPQCVLAEKNPQDWEPTLTHELIHLRRGDHWVSLLQAVVQVVWWFHPLVWWMNRQICRVRERCCDQESVCALAGPPVQYAESLLEVLDAKSKLRPVYGFPGVRPVQITKQRIQEIMTMSKTFQARTPTWCWGLALAVAIVVLPGMPLAGESLALAEEAATTAKQKPAARKPLRLKYGDNKPDGKKSIAGAGEMIRFELPTEAGAVKAIRVHGSRYGYPQAPKEDFEVTLLSADMKEVLHTELVPYSLFKRAKKGRWTHVPFKASVEVPQTFWVVLNFNAEARKGVYVSYDTSTKGQYSRVGTTDEDARETKFGGDWMVQVLLAK